MVLHSKSKKILKKHKSLSLLADQAEKHLEYIYLTFPVNVDLIREGTKAYIDTLYNLEQVCQERQSLVKLPSGKKEKEDLTCELSRIKRIADGVNDRWLNFIANQKKSPAPPSAKVGGVSSTAVPKAASVRSSSSKSSMQSSVTKLEVAQKLKLKKLELQQKLEESRIAFEMKKLDVKEEFNERLSEISSIKQEEEVPDLPVDEDDINNTYLQNMSNFINDCQRWKKGNPENYVDMNARVGFNDAAGMNPPPPAVPNVNDVKNENPPAAAAYTSRSRNLIAGAVPRDLRSTAGSLYTTINNNLDRHFRDTNNIQSSHVFPQINDNLLLRAQLDKPPDKKFGDDFLMFYPFIRNFELTTLKLFSSEPEMCLKRLIDSTTGKAYDTIMPFSLMTGDPHDILHSAIKELYSVFGNKNRIEREYVKQITKGNFIKDSEEDLFSFLVKLKSCQTVLKATDSYACYGNSELVRGVVGRLPVHLKKGFNKVFSKLEVTTPTQAIDSLALIIDLIETRKNYHASSMAEACRFKSHPKQTAKGTGKQGNTFSTQGQSFAKKGSGKGSKKGSSAHKKGSSSEKAHQCLCCKSKDHLQLGKCPTFLEKTVAHRRDFLKKSDVAICENCLKSGHYVATCWSHYTCRQCSEPVKHHTLLCDKPVERGRNNATTSSAVVSNSLDTTEIVQTCDNHISDGTLKLNASISQKTVLFQTLPIKVWNNYHNTVENIRCILDSGSDRSYISSRLADALDLDGPCTDLNIQLADGSVSTCKSKIVSFFGRGLNESYVHKFDNVLVLEKLPDISNKFMSNKTRRKYAHLRNIPFSAKWDRQELDLLIGIDQTDCHILSDVKKGQTNEPYAARSCLGWIIFGIQQLNDSNTNAENTFPTTTSAKLNWAKISNEQLHEQCKNLFNFDYPEYDKSDFSLSTSIQDDRALKIFEDSLRKTDSGHYEVAIPFKSDSVNLPNNFNVVKKRLLNLGKQLQSKKSGELPLYREKMEELKAKNYSVPVPENDISGQPGQVWYCDHHAVCTSSKFRVVFNPSSIYMGTCLNAELIAGPDLANTLLGVLMRFRQYAIALTADIKAMYYQVKVPENQQDFLRYLWFEDGDPSKPIEHNRMTVHAFGVGSSGPASNFVLKKTAVENTPNVPQLIVLIVLLNFYVDDCLYSAPTDEDMVERYLLLDKLCASGKFELRKVESNSEKVLESVESEKLLSSSSSVHELPLSTTLGMAWNKVEDTFIIIIDIPQEPLTKRGILKMITKVFDPFGFLAPFTLLVRSMFQELQSKFFDWDDKVPDSQVKFWTKWYKNLPNLSKIVIPRAFCKWNPDEGTIQLHLFCDASEKGYAAVAYFRFVKLEDICISYVLGKCRVVPKKRKRTTPELELMSAKLAVELCTVVTSEIQYSIDSVSYWSDAGTVIKYINNDTTRQKIFVANRVKFIRLYSDPLQWRYVSTLDNSAADTGSRGIRTDEPDKIDAWLKGPNFLYKDEKEWPCAENDTVANLIEASTLIAECSSNHDQFPAFSKLCEHYSSWSKLKRAVGWLGRLSKWWISKRKGKDYKVSGPLRVQELKSAESCLIKFVQSTCFPGLSGEIVKHGCCKALTRLSGKTQTQNLMNSLKKLQPFVDHDGLIRVGGRLTNSVFKFSVIHPILLPSRHHIVGLMVKFYHKISCHFGTRYVLSRIRKSYWLLQGASTIKRYTGSCFDCKRLAAKPMAQVIAPLPRLRVTPYKRVFAATSTDYMGPILVQCGRGTQKRWLCVFTCLATRAVDIQVAWGLSTDCCINAFRRFMCARGSPLEVLYSDNGTNYTSTNVELKNALKELNQEKIHKELATVGVDWNFNPPASSHQNGVVERIIRSIRKVLHFVLGPKLRVNPNDDELCTFAKEVECILNDRPLCPLSDSLDDFGTLTPSTLLNGALDPEAPFGKFYQRDQYKHSWKLTQHLTEKFWEQWIASYVPTLIKATAWPTSHPNLKKGDLVLYLSDDIPKRKFYPKAIVEEVLPNKDGFVRRAKIRLASGKLLLRDIRKLSLLESDL